VCAEERERERERERDGVYARNQTRTTIVGIVPTIHTETAQKLGQVDERHVNLRREEEGKGRIERIVPLDRGTGFLIYDHGSECLSAHISHILNSQIPQIPKLRTERSSPKKKK
jgi:hypothetical protein